MRIQRKVDPPRARAHPPAPHPRRKADRQRPVLRRPSRLPEGTSPSLPAIIHQIAATRGRCAVVDHEGASGTWPCHARLHLRVPRPPTPARRSPPLLSPHHANPHVPQHIDFAFTSPYGGARAGRVKRKRAAAAAKKEEGGDEEDEE